MNARPNILRVSEKNCYSQCCKKNNDKDLNNKKEENALESCQHVCVVLENGIPVTKLLNSNYIYDVLGSDAPLHIKQLHK
jgi:hypothetical protein